MFSDPHTSGELAHDALGGFSPGPNRTQHERDVDALMQDRAAVSRLLAEHRMFKEAIEKSPVAYCVYDDDDRLVACNETYETLYPVISDRQVTRDVAPGIHYGDLVRSSLEGNVPADELEKSVQARVQAQREADGSLVERDYGERGIFRVVKYPLSNGAVAGMAIDITELKAREDELDQARRIAVASERSKTAFLANMSHELRTPLNAIMGFSELTQHMLDPDTCPKELEYLGYILDGGRHLASLINDLLDLSQLEAQARQLSETIISLPTLLKAMNAILSPLARKKNVEIALLDASEDLTLFGDDRAIRQMILNLGANAIGYTPAGGCVTIDCSINAEREIEVAINDNGPGIPPDELKAIQEPFVRAKSEVKAASTGAGLGLSITRHLASLHDATLSLSSIVGSGTRARVRFPASRTLDNGDS